MNLLSEIVIFWVMFLMMMFDLCVFMVFGIILNGSFWLGSLLVKVCSIVFCLLFGIGWFVVLGLVMMVVGVIIKVVWLFEVMDRFIKMLIW